ncbi:MAG: hypothetical protein JSR99_11835 [Proteobacteria bacterium]|nr:hypothetical protein [Pseudomonadota bacterium]
MSKNSGQPGAQHKLLMDRVRKLDAAFLLRLISRFPRTTSLCLSPKPRPLLLHGSSLLDESGMLDAPDYDLQQQIVELTGLRLNIGASEPSVRVCVDHEGQSTRCGGADSQNSGH